MPLKCSNKQEEAGFDLCHHKGGNDSTKEGYWRPLWSLPIGSTISACRIFSKRLARLPCHRGSHWLQRKTLLTLAQWVLSLLLVNLKVPLVSWKIRVWKDMKSCRTLYLNKFPTAHNNLSLILILISNNWTSLFCKDGVINHTRVINYNTWKCIVYWFDAVISSLLPNNFMVTLKTTKKVNFCVNTYLKLSRVWWIETSEQELAVNRG